jgi:hypothetical protein
MRSELADPNRLDSWLLKLDFSEAIAKTYF